MTQEPKWTDKAREDTRDSRISYIEVLNRACPGGEFARAQFYKKVSRTELLRILLEDTRSVLVTVSFTKKQTPERIIDMIEGADLATMNKTQKKKFAKSLMVGEKQEITGYVLGPDEKGRISMTDLNVKAKNRLRLVDTRTIDHVTLRGTQYHL